MASRSTGGGGGSAAFAADTDHLRATARTLHEVAEAARGTRPGPITGAGEGARAVEEAATRFRGAWEPALVGWSSSLTGLATSVEGAAAALEGADASGTSRWDEIRAALPW
ncbi:hypothetical protein [Mobilicoccus pelagius]|uniref:Uncharacterized protein n=1 Tax=Mobilicoccus pelagius NBRC 104925 TaxID=1089455 RepID=H5UMI0_9MICO|nr:hypothetical protein [Mobilicoccus pelagius]GAB46938.1 hypothetical protein MOPEL_001_00560 [Mobilicoccus pelagius NBRC 104925]